MKFNDLYLKLLKEAEQQEPAPPPSDGGGQSAPSADGQAPSPEDGLGEEDTPPMDIEDDPVSPEEIELAKLAVRALFFNTDSKDVHQFSLKIGEDRIPFEEIPDFFEETKRWPPVIAFVEYVMDKFEGFSSKWSEKPEIKGKNILDKIKYYNKKSTDGEKLDNGKRLYWVRIILNCLLHGKPTENITVGDVNEKNIGEIFDMLKMHYGTDTRGITPGKDIRAPGIF